MGFYVEIKYCLKGRFSSAEIFLMPDAICFEDDGKNCLCIHGISSIYQEDDKFFIYSNYFGSENEVKINCIIHT
jgi:hypothetical protein